MKTFIIYMAGVLFVASSSLAQWSTPVLINPSATYQREPKIALGPQRQIAVATTELGAVVYTSTDNGVTFTRHAVPLPPIFYRDWGIQAVAYDRSGNLFVLWAWQIYDDLGPRFLRLEKSTDGGASFAAIEQRGYWVLRAFPFFIDTSGTIHMVYDRSPLEVCYRKLINGDPANVVEVVLPEPPGTLGHGDDATLLSYGDTVHYALDSGWPGGIYYSRSVDGGVTFPAMGLVDTAGTFEPLLVRTARGSCALLYRTALPSVTARYLIDSSSTFSQPFSLGSQPLGYLGSKTFQVHGADQHLVYDGSFAPYYHFRDLQSPPLDSALFAGFSRPDLAVDTLGGKYYVGLYQYRIYFSRKDVVSGAQVASPIPGTVTLSQNYPNPFNPVTSIKFKVESSKLVTLRVYDVLGREVATLVNEKKEPGSYEVTWDASDRPSGVYFCRMAAPGFVQTRKILLLR